MTEDVMRQLEALRVIAERLLPWYAPWGQFGQSMELYPAALPPDYLDLPVLPGGRLIGSCASGGYSEVFLETSELARSIHRFYEVELDLRGWYKHDVHGQSGFLPPDEHVSTSTLFCRSPEGPSLEVLTTSRTERGMTVRLRLDIRSGAGPCVRPAGRQRFGRTHSHIDDPLPALVLLPGARVKYGTGGGGGGGKYQSHTTIESELSLREIDQHFRTVLLEAGWRLGDTGGAGSVLWSTWSCEDVTGATVAGFLLAYEQSAHVYVVQVERSMLREARERFDTEDRERARINTQASHPLGAMTVIVASPATSGQAHALRALILRIITPDVPTTLPGFEHPQLFAAELPPSLPSNLPLPPDTTVIGALQLRTQIQLYLECDMVPRDILQFYQEQLPVQRWSFFGEQHNRGGFTVYRGPAAASALFCPEGDGPAIELSAHMLPTGVTDLRLTIITELGQTPCRNPDHPARWVWQSRQPSLPMLPPPPNANLSQSGGGGSQVHSEQRAYLYSDLPTGELLAWYADHFTQAGWTEQGLGNDELVGWSRWTKRDDEGKPIQALFLIVQEPGTDRYNLAAMATRLAT